MLKLYFILVEKFNFNLTLLIDIPIWILALKLEDILEYLSQNPSENLIFVPKTLKRPILTNFRAKIRNSLMILGIRI